MGGSCLWFPNVQLYMYDTLHTLQPLKTNSSFRLAVYAVETMMAWKLTQQYSLLSLEWFHISLTSSHSKIVTRGILRLILSIKPIHWQNDLTREWNRFILQHMTIEGMMLSEATDLQDEAFRQSQKWVNNGWRGYSNPLYGNAMFEKVCISLKLVQPRVSRVKTWYFLTTSSITYCETMDYPEVAANMKCRKVSDGQTVLRWYCWMPMDSHWPVTFQISDKVTVLFTDHILSSWWLFENNNDFDDERLFECEKLQHASRFYLYCHWMHAPCDITRAFHPVWLV